MLGIPELTDYNVLLEAQSQVILTTDFNAAGTTSLFICAAVHP